jgi:hypothetical protein
MASNWFEPEVPYKAFSGANIFATIGHKRIGALQALTVSITREVAALYSFSDANPKAFVKGKRGIAGTLVFTQFDRHALLEDVFKGANRNSLRDNAGMFSSRFLDNSTNGSLNGPLTQSSNFDHDIAKGAVSATGDGLGMDIQSELTSVYELVANQKLRYSDQIPEFDITVTMVNESGDAAFCVIGGVQLVNEGWGYTLDDLVSEVAFTYVARSITPLKSLTQDALWQRMGQNPRQTL